MASLKSHLFVLILKLLDRKGGLKDGPTIRETIKKRRASVDYRPGEKIHKRLDIEEMDIGGFPTYVVSPKGKTPDHHVFYLHGGAYVFEIIPPHWSFIADFAHKANATVMVPIYPLAPEHDVLAALDHTEAAWKAFEARVGDKSIHLMGDSAGGGLGLALTQKLMAIGARLPENLFMISPWLDVALDRPEIELIDPADPWLSIGGLQEAGRMYANGLPIDDPRVSPIHGPVDGLPPCHIFIGTRDILMPDCKRFADRLAEAGQMMSYHQEPGMFHCWPLVNMPEAHRARASIIRLMKGRP
ncbi:alpha/beta hydrolase [Kordiimonas lipolytica]|uniref:Alpha/beta hydrolase n=1 Tax=Kordiimonas lipolytica TaxID=1662421 RepID=A0ABV8U7M0_9PROT|nr:alpha/beta hydrolase [Kordiimonas lipolytica]